VIDWINFRRRENQITTGLSASMKTHNRSGKSDINENERKTFVFYAEHETIFCCIKKSMLDVKCYRKGIYIVFYCAALCQTIPHWALMIWHLGYPSCDILNASCLHKSPPRVAPGVSRVRAPGTQPPCPARRPSSCPSSCPCVNPAQRKHSTRYTQTYSAETEMYLHVICYSASW